MREIKYQAWLGYAMVRVIKLDFTRGLDGELKGNGEGYFLKGENEGLRTGFRMSKVSLRQYTGLKDKNGTEIYEGDILYVEQKNTVDPYVPHKENCLVTYVQRDTAFTFGEGQQPIGLYSTSEELQVIGNLYDNPELLEG